MITCSTFLPDTSIRETRAPLKLQNRDQWRDWLTEHHAEATEAWITITKSKYLPQGLGLNDAVEQALCFGWIDSALQSLNERTYALRFSPRKKNSIWSISNIRRVEKLVAAGLMTEAGQQAIEQAKANGQWTAAVEREQVDVIPEALEKELSHIEGAIAKYHALPDSRKKQLIYWLQSAKREATKAKRIQQIIREIVGE